MSESETNILKLNKRALLIVNPAAGRRQVLRYLTQIIRIFMDAGYAVTVMVTARRGEATQMAARFAGEYNLLVCAGGDGTLNEAVSGLASVGLRVPLGYIPCGSTNDFAMSHGLSTDILTAARCVAAGHAVTYDVGRFGERYFSYVAVFGAFSQMAYTTDQGLKNMLGLRAYLLEGLKDLNKIKPLHLRITADGRVHEGDYIFGAISNSLSVAGIVELPKTLVDTCDGKFELFLIKAPETLLELDSIVRSVLAADYNCPLIELDQAAAFTVENPPELQWSLDGESSGVLERAEVTPVPGFLTLRG